MSGFLDSNTERNFTNLFLAHVRWHKNANANEPMDGEQDLQIMNRELRAIKRAAKDAKQEKVPVRKEQNENDQKHLNSNGKKKKRIRVRVKRRRMPQQKKD